MALPAGFTVGIRRRTAPAVPDPATGMAIAPLEWCVVLEIAKPLDPPDLGDPLPITFRLTPTEAEDIALQLNRKAQLARVSP